jgi:hypothetical protein
MALLQIFSLIFQEFMLKSKCYFHCSIWSFHYDVCINWYLSFQLYILWQLFETFSLVNILSIMSSMAIIPIMTFILTARPRKGTVSEQLAWLKETNSLDHPHWKYPGETACRSCQWHWNHFAQPAHCSSGCTLRLPSWHLRRMQDVVCRLVAIRMVLAVQQYVIKADGDEGNKQHGVWHD